MSTSLGTAAAAKLFLAMSVLPAPTVSDFPRAVVEPRPCPIQKTTSRASVLTTTPSVATTVSANGDNYADSVRHTTAYEELIGEIRSWSLLPANWDGEGSAAPLTKSLKEAVSFIRLLGEMPVPESMLLSSGNAALYWNEGQLYGDLEFLGDGRIAYFIKRNGDRHKGVLAFDSKEIPVVFPALIRV
jgi:hypothetical protein